MANEKVDIVMSIYTVNDSTVNILMLLILSWECILLIFCYYAVNILLVYMPYYCYYCYYYFTSLSFFDLIVVSILL